MHTANSTSRALPAAWINRIFDEFSAYFGKHFADMWASSDPENVKRVWAEKLAGFKDCPEVIKHALDCAARAKFPPTLGEFLELCRNAPRKEAPPPALPHKLTPEELEANRKRAADLIAKFAKSKRMPGSE